jgi:hypothetical protein
VGELRTLATRGDPWVFLCASSFLEYLAKAVYGKETGASEYKQFLTTYLFVVCPEYGSFRYKNGSNDLAVQMYHVLRCGIVHAFSLFPDLRGTSKGARTRSIILAHRISGRKHLAHYVNNKRKPRIDSAVFIAEDFVEDIGKLTDYIFAESKRRTAFGRQLKANISSWSKAHPPIGALLIPD